MKIISFAKNRNRYSMYKQTYTNFDFLGLFLNDELGLVSNWWIDMLGDSRKDGMEGDDIAIDKEGDSAYIWSIYWESYPNGNRDPDAFKIEKNKLIRLIKQWILLCKKRPDEIILTYDEKSEEITLQGIHHNSIKPKKIIFYRTNKLELCYDTRDNILGALAEIRLFLLHEVTSHHKKWISFLNDSTRDYVLSKSISVEKIGDIAYIGYARKNNIQQDQMFIIKINKLIELIEQWVNLYKQNYETIIFTQIGENISLEGK